MPSAHKDKGLRYPSSIQIGGGTWPLVVNIEFIGAGILSPSVAESVGVSRARYVCDVGIVDGNSNSNVPNGDTNPKQTVRNLCVYLCVYLW